MKSSLLRACAGVVGDGKEEEGVLPNCWQNGNSAIRCFF